MLHFGRGEPSGWLGSSTIPFLPVLLLTASAAASCSPGRADPGADEPVHVDGADLATAPDQSCGAECSAIEAGVQWLLDHRGVAPNDVVLDVDHTGMLNGGTALAAIELKEIAERMGVRLGRRAETLDCNEERLFKGEPKCRLLGAQVVMAVEIESLSDDDATVVVRYDFRTSLEDIFHSVALRAYRIALERNGPEWTIEEAKLFAAS